MGRRPGAEELVAWKACVASILGDEVRCQDCCQRVRDLPEDSLEPRICWYHQAMRRSAAFSSPLC